MKQVVTPKIKFSLYLIYNPRRTFISKSMKINRFKLILFLILICNYTNAQETKIVISKPVPVKLDEMVLTVSDTFSYNQRIFKIQLSKKYDSMLFPKIGNRNMLVFVDKSGKLENLTVNKYVMGLTRNGTYSEYIIRDNVINTQWLNMIEIGGKATISKITYIDFSNREFKNEIHEFQIIRIK